MPRVNDYQARIDESIQKLGGYWKPLSSLARLIEEFGEACEEILNAGEASVESFISELTDLYIISTCIANQYCADLEEEYKLLGYTSQTYELYQSLPVPEDLQRATLALSPAVGQIARILNHYEGDKKKKKTEKEQRVAAEIAHFHLKLLQLAKCLNTNLFTQIEKILEKNLSRDIGRFELTHDPTTEPARKRFIEHLEKQELLQSRKIWGGSPWQLHLPLEDNIQQQLPLFRRFITCAPVEGLEGLVLEVNMPPEKQHLIPGVYSEIIADILSYLTQQDDYVSVPSTITPSAILKGETVSLYLGKHAAEVVCFGAHLPQEDPRYIAKQGQLFLYFKLK
ncbi:hypothetical protein [Caldalkalibacillus salinus]|uniref:hypothetical protein n=1 Tax=Caldalkalibacillus salinus TaxID=2803787 RepID=UPI001923F151|nr:hypothetical protein [Caldalkalibacillus salinus]